MSVPSAYYNEFDPYAAAWLRNLIAAGHIAPGDVDERDIRLVQPSDLDGYDQCHFFAGIGGWSYALRIAGWRDEDPVWSGSCPCQPFSEAGKQLGELDQRHLWPEFRRLITERRPARVIGEQVAGTNGVLWLDRVAQDLEAKNYAFGAAVLPVTCVGAGHRRDRFFFVADDCRADPAGRASIVRRLSSPQPMASPWAFANWQGGLDSYGVLVDGIPAKLAKQVISGFGNAIVPQLAAEFIQALP